MRKRYYELICTFESVYEIKDKYDDLLIF